MRNVAAEEGEERACPDQHYEEAGLGNNVEGKSPNAATDPERSPDEETEVRKQRASPSPQPNYARASETIATWAKSGSVVLATAGPTAPAEGASTTFTCTAGDSALAEEGQPWWVVFATVVAASAAMAVAFALGRWSAPRLAVTTTTELDPWIVVAEAAETPKKSSLGDEGQGRAPSTTRERRVMRSSAGRSCNM